MIRTVNSQWIWIVLIILGLWFLSRFLAIVVIAFLPPKITLTRNHTYLLIAHSLWIGSIVLIGFVAEISPKLVSLIVLVIFVPLAIAAALGASLPPLKSRSISSYVLKPLPEQAWAALLGRPHWRNGFCGYDELPTHQGHRVWLEGGEHIFAVATWEEIEAIAPYKFVKKSADRFSLEHTRTFLIEPVVQGSRLTIIDDVDDFGPTSRFFSQYFLRYLKNNSRVVQNHNSGLVEMDLRHLRILVHHGIYSGRVDLDFDALVQHEPSCVNR